MPLYPFHQSEDDSALRRTESHVTDDGRINITFPDHARAFFHSLDKKKEIDPDDQELGHAWNCKRRTVRRPKKEFRPFVNDFKAIPRMNVAILITGSRGDVQPFLALGQLLQKPPYSHRVRICTHPDFKDFVEDNGLEFFSIGGDPSKLMAFMVKNPGIIPSLDSIRAGDVGARKADLAEMLEGAWRGCTEAGNGIDRIDLDAHQENVLLSYPPPFVADAIISNPPTYANIHIAEKLAIPCHIMFTMPWSPTRAFAHPLTKVDASKVDNPGLANLLSYKRMELLTWEGLSDIVNHFREKTLALDAVSPLWGHRLFPRLKVPFTYCWSEALIPKPADWGAHITIAGFFFLNLASSYLPDADLKAFLDAGPPPVYIGFGSIVVDDPERLTRIIFDAVRLSGVRALVSKGWGNVGGNNAPDNVFLLGNVPHDFLFPRVSAVVHHGGAGTTAIGIALGKPTVIVPFFGDQPFWANMVYKAGAGPEPIPYKKLTAERLAKNIKIVLQPDVQERAHELSEKIKGEEGPKNAAQSFHDMPQMRNVGCFLCPDRVAVWRVRRTNIQLSSLAVGVLITRGKLKPEQLKLVKHKRWYVEEGSQDPLVAVVGALSSAATGLLMDFKDVAKNLKGRPDSSLSPIHSSRQIKREDLGASNMSSSSSEIEHSGASISHWEKAHPCHANSKSKRFIAAGEIFAGSSMAHIAKLPLELLYNIVNGLHNAPAELGDVTIRVRDPITGLSSGMKVGGKELVFGAYDAVSGLVTQPYLYYQKGKLHRGGPAMGLVKGMGLGLTGLAFKLPAAILGPIGYGGKGLERQIQRWWTGTDRITGKEIVMILRAKDEVKQPSFCSNGGNNAAQLMWDEAKGAGVGRRILERRVWQGYREVRELRQKGEDGAEVERLIVERWEQLEVDEKQFAGLMS